MYFKEVKRGGGENDFGRKELAIVYLKIKILCNRFRFICLCSFILLLPGYSVAQVIPPVVQPRPVAPVERPKIPKAKVPAVKVEPIGDEAPPGATKIFIVLQDIVVEDATVYENSYFRRFFQQFIGKKITLAQVFEISKQIQQQYRADGYILSRVIVPAQSVDNGVFHLRVVEGFINSIKVEGDIGPVAQRVESILQNIIQTKPVREDDLERYLLLANDLPGIQALGFLRSSVGEVGSSELVVNTERKAFDAYALVNNRGSKFTGPFRFSMMVRENSATFLGEQLEGHFLNTLVSDEQHYGQLNYRQFLNNDGLKLSLGASYGPSKPRNGLEAIELETEILTVTGSLNYPFIRSRKQNLYLDMGFQAIDEQVDVFNLKLTRDRLRVFYAGFSYDLIDSWGESFLNLGVRQGVDAFGASEQGDLLLSRTEGVPDHTSINMTASRYQRIWEQFGLLLSGSGQYAFNTLLNAEEFKVGGEVFGRGYNPSELSGDSGLGLAAELQYTLSNPISHLQNLQGYSFYDFASVWNRDFGVDRQQSLASAGFGVRNQLLNHLFVNLEVAWPLTRVPDTFNKDPRFFFQVLVRY